VHLTAVLKHANIVTAHDAGEDGGTYYMAMEYVSGEALEDRLKREGAMPEAEALDMIRKLAGALQYAWEQHRILHRDIKPSNIMLDARGEPRLTDMGLSKSVGVTMGLVGRAQGESPKCERVNSARAYLGRCFPLLPGHSPE